jgi:polyisoprenoid-binding protein YceI
MAADKTAPGAGDSDPNPATEMDPLSGSGEYMVDTEASEVHWTGSKTLIANYEDTGVLGFESGAVRVENGQVVSGTFTFDMTSIVAETTSNTQLGVETLTEHLKSDDFFGVEQYPTATFELASVAEAEQANEYTVNGTLTIKGISNPVTFPAFVYMDGENVHVDADFELDRTLWDVRFGSGKFFEDLGDNVIDDNFRVEAHIVATPSAL